jgi:hypothetical protein
MSTTVRFDTEGFDFHHAVGLNKAEGLKLVKMYLADGRLRAGIAFLELEYKERLKSLIGWVQDS